VTLREGRSANMPPDGEPGRREAVRPVAADRPGRELPAVLRPPRTHGALIERPALLHTLQRSDESLILVCAPAGAGKTATLAQWTEADGRPSVWVQVDEADADPVVLLIYLVRALSAVTEVDPAAEASLLVAVPPVRERILPLIAAALAAAPPFILVLDDVHLLGSSSAWDIVSFLLRVLPPGSQLALGTRSEPPLPLARIRASGELVELGVRDLAFDRGETARFLRQNCPGAGEEDVAALFELTEGWPTGLRLACLASGGRPPSEWLPQLRTDRRGVTAYLTSEVLDRQPADLQAFLLHTSVLLELSPGLCRVVTERDDAGDLLVRVAREELFVVPCDGGEHLRYHHLFGEMLAVELERRYPGRAVELHRRAADWYRERDAPGAAIHHLLAAGEVEAAGDLLAASWTATWNRGQAETVRRWLESFTDRQVLASPALTLTAGWVYTALDAGDKGERWGRAACSAVVDDGPSPDGAASLRSSQALLRATVAADGVRRMRDDAELAARLETRPESSWYADAQVSLGVARWLSGSAQRALHPLAVGARAGASHNASAELAALGYLALIACDEGDWDTAREYEARASARLAELGFGTNRRCLPMLLARVQLLTREPRADLAAATDDVEHLLRHMVPHPWMALLAHVVLGEAVLERADAAGAGAHASAAAALLKRYPDAGTLRRRVESLRAALARSRGAEPLTPAERRVLELLPTHLTEPQIAGQLFVSRNTVKSQLRSVYRKLAVASRAEAVERARELGLLPSA